MSLLAKLIKNSVDGGVGKGPNGTPNCFLWLDADQHPVAPPVVELDSGNVTTWYDKSGIDNHAEQDTSIYKPVYNVDIHSCGGSFRDSIGFDGVNDFLLVPDLPSPGVIHESPAAQLFVVFRAPDQANGTLVSFRHGIGGVNAEEGFSLSIQNSVIRGEVTVDFDCDGNPIPFTIPVISGFSYDDGNFHLISLSFDATTFPTIKLRVDGNNAVSFNLPGVTKLFAAENDVNIGRRVGTGGALLVGELAEIVAYHTSDPTTLSVVENYLIPKWCI